MLLDLLNMRAVSAYRGDGLVDSHRRLYKSWLQFRIQWSRKAATPATHKIAQAYSDSWSEDAKIFSPTYGQPPSLTMKESRLQGVGCVSMWQSAEPSLS